MAALGLGDQEIGVPMSLKKCSVHGARISGKLGSLYAAWFNANGERSAWKQLLCADCAQKELGSLLGHVRDVSSDVTLCPACGIDASEDLDPIYLTLYAPKAEPSEFALTTCASCAVTLRISLQRGATKLPNRVGFGGTNKDIEEADGWESLA